jgi:hypothetical protein
LIYLSGGIALIGLALYLTHQSEGINAIDDLIQRISKTN